MLSYSTANSQSALFLSLLYSNISLQVMKGTLKFFLALMGNTGVIDLIVATSLKAFSSLMMVASILFCVFTSIKEASP